MEPLRYVRVHFWLLAPVQVHSCTAALLAVPWPATSRHSPDSTPTTVPSAFRRHCWFVPPLQVQIVTRVPVAVAWPGTSRHLLPYTRSSFVDVWVHCWLVPPLQS